MLHHAHAERPALDRNRGADDELQAKARKAGVRVSGVPVTDFKGELVMGFDQAKLDQLIKDTNAVAPPAVVAQ